MTNNLHSQEELIPCDGCGMNRRWRGFQCLDICPCMENQASDEEKAEFGVKVESILASKFKHITLKKF